MKRYWLEFTEWWLPATVLTLAKHNRIEIKATPRQIIHLKRLMKDLDDSAQRLHKYYNKLREQ